MSVRSRVIASQGGPAGARDERGRLSPGLMIVGAAVVAFVVALLTMGAGGSGSTDTGAGGLAAADSSKGGECGVGQPDPTYAVSLTSDPNPPRPEGTTFHIAVRHNGDPVAGAKVCMSADMPDMQHPGLTKTAKESSAGVYDADIRFSMSGSWAASVTILEAGKAPVLLTTVFQVTE